MPEPSFLDLFFIFLKTGAFTFGGGYAMIPLLQAQIVPTYLEGPEMSNLIALAQMTPGAVGLNTATYVGYSEYSFIGAVCCTLALILPCFTVATIVSFFKKAFQDNKYVKNALFGIRAMVEFAARRDMFGENVEKLFDLACREKFWFLVHGDLY